MFDLINIGFSIVFSFTMGWYFVHVSKDKKDKNKIFFWAISSVAIIILWIGSNYIQNKTPTVIEYYPQKESLNVLYDSIKTLHFSVALAETISKNTNQKYELAKKYLTASNEPFIRIYNAIPHFKIGEIFIIDIEFQNTGGTSAKPLAIFSDYESHTIKYSEFTLPIKPDIIYDEIGRGESKVLHLKSKKLLSQALFDNIMNGAQHLYVFGRFIYYDISKKKYSKDYCFLFDTLSKSMTEVHKFKFYHEKIKLNKETD